MGTGQDEWLGGCRLLEPGSWDEQARDLPVAMVKKRKIEGRNVGSVSIKTKLTRALGQNPELYLGSEFL